MEEVEDGTIEKEPDILAIKLIDLSIWWHCFWCSSCRRVDNTRWRRVNSLKLMTSPVSSVSQNVFKCSLNRLHHVRHVAQIENQPKFDNKHHKTSHLWYASTLNGDSGWSGEAEKFLTEKRRSRSRCIWFHIRTVWCSHKVKINRTQCGILFTLEMKQ